MADPAPAINVAPETAPDPEVAAITKVNEALSALEPAVRQRVLKWAADRFGLVPLSTREREEKRSADDGERLEDAHEQADSFADFASLYDAANPATDADRALVGGYWLQEVQGSPDWGSLSANRELKNLGHGPTNIADTLSKLTAKKPQLVMQTHKSGKAKQGRKKYKLTGVGIKRVREMLTESGDGE